MRWINISDEYINEKMFQAMEDTGFMLQRQAVAGFTAMFLEMWNVNDEHIEDCGEYIQASKIFRKYGRICNTVRRYSR